MASVVDSVAQPIGSIVSRGFNENKTKADRRTRSVHYTTDTEDLRDTMEVNIVASNREQSKLL